MTGFGRSHSDLCALSRGLVQRGKAFGPPRGGRAYIILRPASLLRLGYCRPASDAEYGQPFVCGDLACYNSGQNWPRRLWMMRLEMLEGQTGRIGQTTAL